jgi:hypothetical protein
MQKKFSKKPINNASEFYSSADNEPKTVKTDGPLLPTPRLDVDSSGFAFSDAYDLAHALENLEQDIVNVRELSERMPYLAECKTHIKALEEEYARLVVRAHSTMSVFADNMREVTSAMSDKYLRVLRAADER